MFSFRYGRQDEDERNVVPMGRPTMGRPTMGRPTEDCDRTKRDLLAG